MTLTETEIRFLRRLAERPLSSDTADEASYSDGQVDGATRLARLLCNQLGIPVDREEDHGLHK